MMEHDVRGAVQSDRRPVLVQAVLQAAVFKGCAGAETQPRLDMLGCCS